MKIDLGDFARNFSIVPAAEILEDKPARFHIIRNDDEGLTFVAVGEYNLDRRIPENTIIEEFITEEVYLLWELLDEPVLFLLKDDARRRFEDRYQRELVEKARNNHREYIDDARAEAM